MRNKLIDEQQHKVTRGNLVKDFHIKAYQGRMTVSAKYKKHRGVVRIKAYKIYVSERWTRDGEIVFQGSYDTQYFTSRSNNVGSMMRLFTECSSTQEMHKTLKPLREKFYADIKRDAERQLQRELGLIKPSSNVLQSNKKHQPLPQIQLPWDSEDKD
jgi:hypothetical protein